MKKLLLFVVFFTLIGEASEKSINDSWCSEMDGIYSDKSICLWKINKLPDLNLV